jgi:hypothetical protein
MSEAPNYGDDDGEFGAPLFIGVSDQAGSVIQKRDEKRAAEPPKKPSRKLQ